MTVSKSTSVDSNNYSRRCERIYFPAGQTPRKMLNRRTTTSEVSCAATAAVSTGSHAEIMHWDVPRSLFSLRLFSAMNKSLAPLRRLLHDQRFSIWTVHCLCLLVMTYLPEIREESSSDFIVPTSLCALLVLTVTPGVTNLTSPTNGYKLVPSCFLERLWLSLYNIYLSCTRLH